MIIIIHRNRPYSPAGVFFKQYCISSCLTSVDLHRTNCLLTVSSHLSNIRLSNSEEHEWTSVEVTLIIMESVLHSRYCYQRHDQSNLLDYSDRQPKKQIR